MNLMCSQVFSGGTRNIQ